MPKILPPGGEVDWPSTEGTLGVVGFAPWATLEFCRVLYAAVRATKDWHFPRVLVDINTKIPSRGRHLELGEADPSPAIAATIGELADQGAALAVVVSNTAHISYERWSRDARIPVLHIVDETANLAMRRGAKRVTPFVSSSLAKHDLYGARVQALGLACTRLEPGDQELVSELIGIVKVSGGLDPKAEETVARLLERLKSENVDTIVAGCTELSVLEGPCRAAGLRFVDSNSALALAALRRLHLPESRIRS